MEVREIMTENPACCTPDATLQDVARLMVENDCGLVPVVDALDTRRLIGVITDRDICCRVIAEGHNPLELRATDVMSSSPVAVTEDASVKNVCVLMEDKMIRRVPVVDEVGNCCGIVTQADLAKRAPAHISEVVREVSQATSAASNV